LNSVGSLRRHQPRLGLLSKNHKKNRLSKTTMSTLQSIPETSSTLDALRIVAAEYDAAVADLVDKLANFWQRFSIFSIITKRFCRDFASKLKTTT
jgi:hypothetical protein